MQGLLKRSTKVTQRLECDATGIYNRNRHMMVCGSERVKDGFLGGFWCAFYLDFYKKISDLYYEPTIVVHDSTTILYDKNC